MMLENCCPARELRTLAAPGFIRFLGLASADLERHTTRPRRRAVITRRRARWGDDAECEEKARAEARAGARPETQAGWEKVTPRAGRPEVGDCAGRFAADGVKGRELWYSLAFAGVRTAMLRWVMRWRFVMPLVPGPA
jgi:hypothetical protein